MGRTGMAARAIWVSLAPAFLAQSITDVLRDPAVATVVGIVGAAIGVVGTAVAIVSVRVARRSTKPVWRMRTATLIDRRVVSLVPLKILHNDQALVALSLTRIALWNAGRDAILREDITEAPAAIR